MPDPYHFCHGSFLERVCGGNKPSTECANVSDSLCRTLTLPAPLAIDWWKTSNSCYQGNHLRLWIDSCLGIVGLAGPLAEPPWDSRTTWVSQHAGNIQSKKEHRSPYSHSHGFWSSKYLSRKQLIFHCPFKILSIYTSIQCTLQLLVIIDLRFAKQEMRGRICSSQICLLKLVKLFSLTMKILLCTLLSWPLTWHSTPRIFELCHGIYSDLNSKSLLHCWTKAKEKRGTYKLPQPKGNQGKFGLCCVGLA